MREYFAILRCHGFRNILEGKSCVHYYLNVSEWATLRATMTPLDTKNFFWNWYISIRQRTMERVYE